MIAATETIRSDCAEALRRLAADGRRYPVILADPPWAWGNWSDQWHAEPKQSQSRWVGRKYDCLTGEEIAALPVADIAARSCVLLLWATAPTLPTALRVMEEWGFPYRTVAFVWVKQTGNGRAATGMGYYTRSNAELVLLGVHGAGPPARRSHSVGQVLGGETQPDLFDEPEVVRRTRRGHSVKPDCVQTRIEELFDGPYLELFARRARPGWTCVGDQVAEEGVA